MSAPAPLETTELDDSLSGDIVPKFVVGNG